MFKLNLVTILAAFTKVEEQLKAFLDQNTKDLEVNAEKAAVLDNERNVLIADAAKAGRVLERVKALTE